MPTMQVTQLTGTTTLSFDAANQLLNHQPASTGENTAGSQVSHVQTNAPAKLKGLKKTGGRKGNDNSVKRVGKANTVS